MVKVIYIKPTVLSIFSIFAMVSYSIMFVKYVKSKRSFHGNIHGNSSTSSTSSTSSIVVIFSQSRFFISVLLVASYLLLSVIPYLMNTVWFLVDHKGSKSFKIYPQISRRVSHTVDSVIYIFIQPPVRKMLLRICHCGNQVQSTQHNNTLTASCIYQNKENCNKILQQFSQ